MVNNITTSYMAAEATSSNFSLKTSAQQHVCILSQTHLCRNPRVWKESIVLHKAGYKVTILTTFYDEVSYKEDTQLLDKFSIQYESYVDLRTESKNYLKKLYFKIQRKFGNWLVRNKIKNTALALGYGHRALYRKALQQNAALYICHQEMATYVGTLLLKKGKKVAFDLEDWYSEDLLPEARRSRPIGLLKKIEFIALTKSYAAWTTSMAMATAMANTYQTPTPTVVYNSFPKSERPKEEICKDRVDTTKVSLFWFSQTIGPGRGLEMLISTLHSIDLPFELHLRGNINDRYRSFLLDQFPKKADQTLYFHPLVSNAELPQRIAEHDIGLALESKKPISRNYTITNKILQYLEAGVTVVASNTDGQIEVAEKATGAVYLFNQKEELVNIISKLISSRVMLREAKSKAKQAYHQNFLWDSEEEKLCQLVESALSK